MATDWMKKLSGEFAKAADTMPKPSEHVITLPSPSLNWAVGNGGITQGKAVVLFGPESGGKSLIKQLIYIQMQKDFPEGIIIDFDTEFSFNPEWFEKLGGDLSRLIIKQTNDPYEIFDYIANDLNEMIQDGCPIVGLGIDSIKAIRYPKEMNKKKSTDMTMGGSGASYLGGAFKMILPVIRKHNITTVLVQQVYMEMDQYKAMIRPYIVPDGFALKHFADYMFQVDRWETKDGRIEDGKNMAGGFNQVGHKLNVKLMKNRVSAPYRVAQLSLRYDTGIVDQEREIYALAESLGVLGKKANPNTGKLSMIGFTRKDGTDVLCKSKAEMEQWVADNRDSWGEIMDLCYQVSDSAVAARNDSIITVDAMITEDDL